MKIKDILKYTKEKLCNIDDYELISKIAIEFFFQISRDNLVVHMDEEIDDNKFLEYTNIVKKIESGIPIQYITNKQDFMNISLYVDENVLIPQPDTEVLVENVIDEYKKCECKILDLCTGSGAIGISLAKNIEKANVYLSDISSNALKIADLNSKNNGVSKKVHILNSDLFDQINEKEFDCIVSNPPYIKTAVIEELDNQVKNEPHIALDGGEDGLVFYRKIAQNAYKYIKNGGKLYLEIGYDQKNSVIDLLSENGKYVDIYSIKDYGNNDRVVIATVRR